MMNRIITTFFLLVIAQFACGQDSLQQIVTGRKNAATQVDKPYVILISADGFGTITPKSIRPKT